MKKMINLLIGCLVLLLSLTWYYRLPYTRRMGNRAMVIVHHVKHLEELKAEYIIITKIDDRIIIEIIKGPGPENVDVLKDKEARRYLINAGLDYGG